MSFITFGCWNKGTCTIGRDSNGMSAVIRNLIYDRKNPMFYLVSGDNYYPDKDKKREIKLLNKSNLHSGMNCIKQLTKKAPVFMLMGNHDVKYENKLHDIIDNKKIDKCQIIKEQLIYKDDFNFDRYFTTLNKNTICLFINSMLYTDDHDEIYDCIKKYRELHYKKARDISGIISIDELILTNILELISDDSFYNITNIIICGHDPIVTRRVKKKKDRIKDLRLPLYEKGLSFLEKLYNYFPDSKKYYICSDTHQYQKSEIILNDNEITQYVVGTGGTDCDLDDIEPDEDFVNIEGYNLNLQYKLIETIKAYGFLHCKSSKDNKLNFDFKTVGDCSLNLTLSAGLKKTKHKKIKKNRVKRKKKEKDIFSKTKKNNKK